MAFASGSPIGNMIDTVAGTVIQVVNHMLGGSVDGIITLVHDHTQELIRIENLRDEIIQKSKIRNEQDIHRQQEFRELFNLFKLQVEQAETIIEQAEFINDNGVQIKGYEGKA